MSWVARPHERGSALLIVFVFAAIVAITLYMELPVAAFEAKRQKEQLLIDRGHEYAHAVKLYVRKFGSYPTSMDQLENTNRMRFLRHRFKDPFTGKEDWRLLHAGPGGMLVDSKTKPTGLGQNASALSLSSGSGSTAATGSSSGQAGFGSSSQNVSADAVVVPEPPQRPPAISSGGGPSMASGNGAEGATANVNDQSPTAPLLPPGETDQLAGTTQNGAAGAQPGNPAANAQTGTNTAGQAPQGGTDTQNSTDTVRRMLNNPAIGAPLPGSGVTATPLGQISSGGIAGVASIAKGHTIKTVNDQTDYSLWEFYYDPSKDATRLAPGMGQGGTLQMGAAAGATATNGMSSNQGMFGNSAGASNQAATTTTTPAPASPPGLGATQGPPQ